jgi:hypothetical protein
MSTIATADVIALVREHYRVAPAPAPSPALASRMSAGPVALRAVTNETHTDERTSRQRDHVARFHARARTRYLGAGVAAAFVATSGLAVAGSLPDLLQREISSAASFVGVDLPSPADTPASGRVPDAPSPSPEVSTPSDAGASSAREVPTTSAPAQLPIAPSAQSDEATPTTLPSSGLDAGELTDRSAPLGLPIVTTPNIELRLARANPLPFIALPPITLP